MKHNTLILGASSEIGCDLIKRLSDTDNIIGHYNKSNKLNHPDIKGKVIQVQADLSNESDIYSMISYIRELELIPDKIVHLAAPPLEFIRFKDSTWDDYHKNIGVQFKSIYLILDEFLPDMVKQRSGKIVFVLSSVINNTPKFLSHYTSTKYALFGLMRSLANEYADKNIQINAVSPSMVDTEFLKNIPKKIIEITRDNHPLKRIAKPDDVTPLIEFLLSSDSDYMTGINIPVCGEL